MKVNNDLRKKAEKLAEEPYRVDIMEDKTVKGERVYFVEIPELPGCIAQGFTIEEAMKNIHEARIEYILSLLEDDLPVPTMPISTTADSFTYSDTEFHDIQPERQRRLVEIYWAA